MSNVLDIISECGGKKAILGAIERRGGNIGSDAIRKWKSSGIPEKWWGALLELNGDLTPWDLHQLNENLREAA